MLTKEEAIKKVEMKINEDDADYPHNSRLEIINNSTIEKNWGWVFFYQSSDYLKTANISSQLIGNSPYIVNKESGQLLETGTSQAIEHYINDYESKLNKKNEPPPL
jgi:hypothetical protein